MASKLKLSGQEIRRLKNDLRGCEEIREDMERAAKAGVPNVEKLQEALDKFVDRINGLLVHLGGEEIKS